MNFAGCRIGDTALVELMATGPEVREASHRLGTFSPSLDRDLADLLVTDAGDPDLGRPFSADLRRAVLIDRREVSWPGQASAFPSMRALVVAGDLCLAESWSQALGPGQVWAVGARAYSRQQRDQIRSSQRLLPLHEVELTVALRTAVLESEEEPLWVVVDLNVLHAHLVPGVTCPTPEGASLSTLKQALAAVPGERVVGFELVGYPGFGGRNNFTALTAAELLRDNILTWWGPQGRKAPGV